MNNLQLLIVKYVEDINKLLNIFFSIYSINYFMFKRIFYMKIIYLDIYHD